MHSLLKVECSELCAEKAGWALRFRTLDDEEVTSVSFGLLFKVNGELFNHCFCRVMEKAGCLV